MDKDHKIYQWVVESPIGDSVSLTQDTFNDHIIGEDKRTVEEVEHLVSVSEDVKLVIGNPRFIYKDNNYEENSRYRYVDLIYCEEFNHIQALIVVVDTDREPHEVVTWTIKRNLNQEKGGVIYDSRKNK